MAKNNPAIVAQYCRCLALKASQDNTNNTNNNNMNEGHLDPYAPAYTPGDVTNNNNKKQHNITTTQHNIVSNIDMKTVKKAEDICFNALKKYPGHVALIDVHKLCLKIQNKSDIKTTSSDELFQPQTTAGMVGYSILKAPPKNDNDNNTDNNNDNNNENNNNDNKSNSNDIENTQ